MKFLLSWRKLYEAMGEKEKYWPWCFLRKKEICLSCCISWFSEKKILINRVIVFLFNYWCMLDFQNSRKFALFVFPEKEGRERFIIFKFFCCMFMTDGFWMLVRYRKEWKEKMKIPWNNAIDWVIVAKSITSRKNSLDGIFKD